MTANVASLVGDSLDLWTSSIERKSGAGRGGGNKVSFYGIERLRALILDLAVRGKLVPQDPADSPAIELLKSIKFERAELIKTEAIGKGKALPTVSREPPFVIPESWVWVQISDIGHDWGQMEPRSDFTYIDVGSINQDLGAVGSPTVMSASNAPSRARKTVRRGTVIYSTVRPYLRNIAVIDRDFEPKPIASTAFAIVHPFEGIEAGFVFRYLRSPAFVQYVESCQTGIAYPAINERQFFAAWFPLPPRAEQQRIVAKVDELMALCDELEAGSAAAVAAHQRLVETLLARLVSAADTTDLGRHWARLEANFDALFTTGPSIDSLQQAILELGVTGKLIEKSSPDEWNSTKLGKVIGPMSSGWSPACLTSPSRNEDTWGVLKTTSVQRLDYQPEQNKELPESLRPRPDAECQAGDILITRAGPTNRVGICCYVTKTRPRLMISDKIVRFRPEPDVVDGAYLALALSVGPAAAQIERAKSGMAASQVNISQAKLREVRLSLPPLPEQKLIVAKVDQLLAVCENLRARLADTERTRIQLADAVVEQVAA